MKTQLRFLPAFLMLTIAFIPTKAIDYTISFTGSGASTTVDSVVVQNLTKSTQVTVPLGVQFILYDPASAVDELNLTSGKIAIYPNPMNGNATFTFLSTFVGKAQITVYRLDGAKVAALNTDVQEGKNSFHLSLPAGMYLIQAQGTDFSYSAKAFSVSTSTSEPKISFSSIATNSQQQRAPAADVKLLYNAGDQLLFKGYAGNYCTIVTDKPTGSKTIDFKFVECKDVEGNQYAAVMIGTQIWMAENLKTSRYRNGDEIATTTKNSIPNDSTSKFQWAFERNESNVANYGRLYTWWAVTDARGVAPTGWHVPTDAEWTQLENYLIANGYNFDGTTTGNKIANSLASTTDWISWTVEGAPGYDMTKNNSSGFTALPAGDRVSYGSFFGLGSHARWQSSSMDNTFALIRYLGYGNNFVTRSTASKIAGYSVRCVKDADTAQPASSNQ